MIVYELAGQPHLRLPLSIVVMTAYFVGNRFSKMVYEVLIDTNGTPFMPEIPKKFANLPVAQVMLPVHRSHVLALDSTYREGIELLKAIDDALKEDGTVSHAPKFAFFSSSTPQTPLSPSDDVRGNRGGIYRQLSIEQPYLDEMQPAKMMHYTPNVIPVVQSKRSMVIVGAVLRSDLKHAVMELQHAIMVASTEPVQLGRVNEDDEDLDDDNDDTDGKEDGRAGNFSPTEQSIAEGSQQPQQYYQQTSPISQSHPISNNEPFTTPNNRTSQLATGPRTFSLDDNSASNSYLMSSGNLRANAYRDSLDEDRIQHHPLMQQTMQFAIIGDGGRSIIPVATRRKQAKKSSLTSSSSLATATMALPLDPSPYQIVDSMQLKKVDLLFRMLSLNQAYVTHSGQLVGLVTRSSLREFLGRHTKRPLDRCTQLGMAIWQYCRGYSNENVSNEVNRYQEEIKGSRGGYQYVDRHDDGHVNDYML